MRGRLARIPTLHVLLLVPALLIAQTAVASPDAIADPAAAGEWSAPFDLGVIGIHSTVLHTGEVLLWDYPAGVGTRAELWDPATGTVTDVSLDFKRDLFCSGHIVLPDGRVLATGGTIYGATHFDGTRKNDVFDPVTRTWTESGSMAYGRWYPTDIETPSGKILIFSGQADNKHTIRRVERYNPVTGTVTALPKSANRYMDLYPRVFLLPNGKFFWAGEEQGTQMLDPATARWSFVGDMNYGSRYEGTAVLLPGLEKVLTFGGDSPPTDTAEVIDFSDPSPQWEYTGSLNDARKHANAVLLPDGTVLAVGGGLRGSYDQPVTQAELYDPATGTWTEMASQTAGRMYHSTAVLLPDGRVLSAGMDHGPYQETGEIYSPPYLFKGPRPTIASAPASLGYGESFFIQTPDAADIARVALIHPGSATHSVNFAQRYVDVSFSVSDGSLQAAAPASGAEAPPGWYMMFIVSSSGVPSVASWVQVG